VEAKTSDGEKVKSREGMKWNETVVHLKLLGYFKMNQFVYEIYRMLHS